MSVPKRATFLLVFLFYLFTAVPAFASGSLTVFTIGSHIYTVDGQKRSMDVAPYTQNGRTFLPVRYVAMAIGISSDHILYQNGLITLLRGDTVVQLTVGSNVMLVNGKAVTMDVMVTTLHGRAMLPAAWVCRAFGTIPAWDGANHTLTIKELDPENPGNQGGSTGAANPDSGNSPVNAVPYDMAVIPQRSLFKVVPSLKYPPSVNTVGRDYQWRYNGIIYRWHVEIPSDLLDWDRKISGVVDTFYNSNGITQAIMLSSMSNGLKRLVASCSENAGGNFVPWVNESLNYTYAGVLAECLSQQARVDGYDYFHTAEFVQSFVGGAISYRVSSVPQLPAQTLVDAGNCKDKSILLAAILKNMGYKVALLFYPPPAGQTTGHMAVGIAFNNDEIPAGRTLWYYSYNDTKYYFAETTEPGWLIGQVSDEQLEKSGYVYPVS